MKLTKRIFAIILTVVIAAAFTLPAFAQSGDNAPNNQIASREQGDVLLTGADDEAAGQHEGTVSDTLMLMGKGMLGIFIVMSIIFILIIFLNKITQPRAEKKKKSKSK